MKCKNINDIVIVGGGSAGWMVAATLISQFPNKKITVLESKNIPTVGVGESTVGGIRGWLNVVGIEDHQFMPHCDAVYKLAIKFTDFYESNSGSWYYPFGHPAADYKDWFIKKALYPNTSSEDFAETLYPQMQLVKENRILNSIEKKLSPWQLEHSAFHFDAAKFGEWLRKNYCLPKNVTHKTGTIVNCSMSENGIERLLLDNNEDMTADLYIDCTGFQALLIDKYLKTPFHSYEDILPNNRAWAARIPYTNKEKQLTLHTECTAIDYGWIWNIPLWSRIGTGLVYSDKFLDPLAAKTKFLNYLRKNHNAENIELKDIKMRVGTHEKYWNKNVVAIGLSAAFIEPLESTGLVTVHDWAIELCKTLERGSVSQWDIDEYNKTCRDQFEYWSQFVSMHYALSHRTDSDYWQYVTSEHLIDKRDKLSNLQSQNLWHQSIYQKRYKFELPDDYGVRCLAAGMNWNPINTVTLKKQLGSNINLKDHFADLTAKLENQKKIYIEGTRNSKSLTDFYQKSVFKPKT